jgi:hypothetical protein
MLTIEPDCTARRVRGALLLAGATVEVVVLALVAALIVMARPAAERLALRTWPMLFRLTLRLRTPPTVLSAQAQLSGTCGLAPLLLAIAGLAVSCRLVNRSAASTVGATVGGWAA